MLRINRYSIHVRPLQLTHVNELLDSARKVAFLEGFDILFEKRVENVADQGRSIFYAGNPSKLLREGTLIQ